MGCYVCIHCHFYQPPRENPWLEAVEAQDSAQPYHDWNERINAECYRANTASRILDGQGRIAQIVNNYARISFNFGPTLLSWMEQHDPESYNKVLEADRESQTLFSGHGSALAQAYNHMILPLANARDKHTQIAWGMQDFHRRFKRDPEGMWLAETAVDVETLEALSAAGIKFTVLSPYQANKMRADAKAPWTSLNGHGIDSKRAYTCHLPSGRSISLFFYDGQVARAVAFDKLLFDGANLARRLTGRYDPQGDSAQLIHIATDGETYGHHHPHGDMALAYALDYIETNQLAKITNYGEYLTSNPPLHEVEILGKTSWSCAHGIGRWQEDCGCNATNNGGWNQKWRKPLREALDWLRDSLTTPYERAAKKLLRDPWAARDAYIEVVLDRSVSATDSLIKAHALKDLSAEEKLRVLRLLELQRHLMLMYTSCGWFFDEPTGPETVQVLQYAGRAAQLGEQLFGGDREEQLLRRLEKMHSNLTEFGNGRQIYERFVRPAMLDLPGVAAHYAISSLFDGYLKRESMYAYAVDLQDAQVLTEGKKKFSVGHATLRSRITQAQMSFNFAVLHVGDHNLKAGVGPGEPGDGFQDLAEEVGQAFSQGNLEYCAAFIDTYFRGSTYSLKSLFHDVRQRIVTQLVDASLADLEEVCHRVYGQHAPQVSFLSELHIPLPEILQVSAQFVLDSTIRRCLAEERPDFDHIGRLLDEAKRDGIKLLPSSLKPALLKQLENVMKRWRRKPEDLATLESLAALVSLARVEPFNLDLWETQNQYYAQLQAVSTGNPPGDHTWLANFQKLGEALNIAVPKSLPQLAKPESKMSVSEPPRSPRSPKAPALSKLATSNNPTLPTRM